MVDRAPMSWSDDELRSILGARAAMAVAELRMEGEEPEEGHMDTVTYTKVFEENMDTVGHRSSDPGHRGRPCLTVQAWEAPHSDPALPHIIAIGVCGPMWERLDNTLPGMGDWSDGNSPMIALVSRSRTRAQLQRHAINLFDRWQGKLAGVSSP